MLIVPKALYEQMIAHCQGRYPKEACGILAASSADGASAEATAAIYPMRNVEDSPIGYSMDPKEQLQVEKQMRQRRHRLLAIYHSHTASDAYPSSVDVSLAISPELYYVLVSLKDRQRPAFRAFRIEGPTITEQAWAFEEAAGSVG